MGLRFRRSLQLFPGVRLNFSTSGVSTTIGGRGVSTTLGPRGTYLNLSAPGTGISHRSRLDGPTEREQEGPPRRPDRVHDEVEEIESAPIQEIESAGLASFRSVMDAAHGERVEVLRQINRLKRQRTQATQRLRKTDTFFGRLFRQGRIDAIRNETHDFTDALRERGEYLDECKIALDSRFHKDIATTAKAVIAACRRAGACEALWDVSGQRSVDQVAERSTASLAVERQPVRFEEAQYDLIDTRAPSFRIENANGPDIYLYPAFVLLEEGDRFALLEYGEIDFAYEPVHFTEEEAVPNDATVTGTTWFKVNKDGSPDRRYGDNYEIPQCRYGFLSLASDAGVNERYMFSNYESGEALHQALLDHQRALATRS